MSKTEIRTGNIRQIADETAWRDFWYAHVMTETGERGPAKKYPFKNTAQGQPVDSTVA